MKYLEMYTRGTGALLTALVLVVCGGESPGGGGSGAPPQIVSFDSRTWNIAEEAPVTFTALGFDEDGGDDIAEAYVETVEGQVRIGELELVSVEGWNFEYTIDVSWDELYTARPFTLDGGEYPIGLTAVVVDRAGNVGTLNGFVTATCGFGDYGQVCVGDCVSLYGDATNCGECGNVCEPGDSCSAGVCSGRTGWGDCISAADFPDCTAYCESESLTCSAACGLMSGFTEVDDIAVRGYFNETCTASPHVIYREHTDSEGPHFTQSDEACAIGFGSWPGDSDVAYFKCCCVR